MSSPYDMPDQILFRRVVQETRKVDGAFSLTVDDTIWTAEVFVAGEIKIRIMGAHPDSVLETVLSQISILSTTA